MTVSVAATALPGLDLSSCESEPIHVPGSIQPHGTLLVLTPADHLVLQGAANVDEVFGRSAGEILGQPVDSALPLLAAASPRELGQSAGSESGSLVGGLELSGATPRRYDIVVHRGLGDLLVVELKETLPGSPTGFETVFPLLRGFVDQLQHASTIAELCAVAAQDVRRSPASTASCRTGSTPIGTARWLRKLAMANFRAISACGFRPPIFPARRVSCIGATGCASFPTRITCRCRSSRRSIRAPDRRSTSACRSCAASRPCMSNTCATWARHRRCRSRSCARASCGT
jgi:hypothetical protein